MPRGNKTGPDGEGSMTGRAQGYCTGNNQPGFVSNQPSQGQGFGGGGGGRGGGRGRGVFNGRNMGRGFGFGSGQGFRFRRANQNVFVENDPSVSDKTLIENDIRVIAKNLVFMKNSLTATR